MKKELLCSTVLQTLPDPHENRRLSVGVECGFGIYVNLYSNLTSPLTSPLTWTGYSTPEVLFSTIVQWG